MVEARVVEREEVALAAVVTAVAAPGSVARVMMGLVMLVWAAGRPRWLR